MSLSSEHAVDRILRALGEALRATKRIGEIEARIGRSRGYFSKVASRKWRISLDVLLETLKVLEIDPETFFSRALAPDEDGDDESPPGAGSSGRPAGPNNLADLPDDALSDRVSYWRSR